jgi:hypothetical protein
VLTSLGDRWPAPRGSAPSVSSTAAVERPVGPEIDVAHDDVNGVCREAVSMIGYPVYKFFHVLTIVALVAGLATLLLVPVTPDNRQRRRLTHWVTGIAATLALISGFGLHARLGGVWQGWVVTKIVVWLALLLILVRFRAGPVAWPAGAWLLTLLPAAVAIFMAVYKPF